ncbi:MAG: hypothetical protein LHW46_01875 [Candidatus Cloacimonetes bacterium]|jgi:hypothetical protein|nr:hypothetical protein [Candidatus Cloacimonadota bacterium]MDY0336634.1 hypothetical protein [Candidatus Cloacimonadaceae bacterium]MCB5269023.1 hypothetical protein [Candidatus Cloacimonadota bacterium]MCK9334037.1 hypothetical protein [Candidatus Cloacimonadota bacterium]MDD2543318.1 hypothetical protein [Candidatus Cloacimonadota bacterium]
MPKLIVLSLLFVAYNLLFGILWLSNWQLQLLAMLIIGALSLIFVGWQKCLKQFRLLLPFVGTLVLIYGIFIIFDISPGEDTALSYWLAYGLPRILLLISSIYLLRFFISFMRIEDFYDSGISIHLLKYLILGRILYQAAFESYPLIKAWQSLIPSEQLLAKGFRQRFRSALTASLALALYVLEEAVMKGEMIDNRIANCYKEQP